MVCLGFCLLHRVYFEFAQCRAPLVSVYHGRVLFSSFAPCANDIKHRLEQFYSYMRILLGVIIFIKAQAC